MDNNFIECIEDLRKTSRTLLAQIDTHSKRINNKVKQLHSLHLTSRENLSYRCDKTDLFQRNIRSWKQRNDSSGVNGVLCPDYFHTSPKHTITSMPNMPHSGKLQLISKKRGKGQCSDNVYRKPVKECYCNSEIKKALHQTSTARLGHNSIPQCCKSHADFRSVTKKENSKPHNSTPPISCETLRRVQHIDYTPRSQFLRNVQSKISLLQNAQMGDCSDTHLRTSCWQKLSTPKGRKKESPSQSKRDIQNLKSADSPTKSTPLPAVSTSSEVSEEDDYSEQNDRNKSNKAGRVPLQKQLKSKFTIKKTLSSKKNKAELKKDKSKLKVDSKTRRSSQLSLEDCPCCSEKKFGKSEESTLHHGREKYPTSLDYHKKKEEHLLDKEVKDLRKFREQNYFDTHGSSHVLQSSRSSGSLEQCLLNDRLFPQPVRKLHKRDLVVTMPPCATMQRKRVHYFPRYIVRQEKSSYNTNYKKRRYQSCPLTGHAVDLGVIKINSPINSLALKYQKQLP